MEELISLDMILNLPYEISNISKDAKETITLLRKEVYERFDTKELKNKINSLFNHYNDVIYLHQFPDYRISLNYDPSNVIKQRSISDKVGDTVSKLVDEQYWVTQFYYRLLNLSKKLTKSEIVYLEGTFFRRKTEDNLCEKLGICRNTLRGIKKSCLVKMWIELESLYKQDVK